jgi:hypothetical protein
MDVWSWLQTHGGSIWQIIERASWAIAITALPLGLVQLWFVWQEQKRITRELTRQPDLQVGFFSPDGKLAPVVYVVTQWDANTKRSAPFELKISSHNIGARSAHNAMVTIAFPQEASITSSKATFGPAPNIAGHLCVWDKQPDVHPDVYSDHAVTLTVPESLKDGFAIPVTVSMDDQPTKKHVLAVKFLKTTEAQAVPEKTG